MNVCYKCIGDEYLSQEIRKDGYFGVCDFCNKKRRCYSIESIAERVKDVVETHYQRHQDEYGADDGEPVQWLIFNLLDCSERLADAVRSKISEDSSWEARDGGYSDPFSSEACYVEKSADIRDFRQSWGFFRSEIGTRSRYFSESARETLKAIFGDLSALTTWNGEPVIQVVGPASSHTHAFRGRVALSDSDIETFLKSPAKELGPPPSHLATPGRMNARGITAFYGALELQTCVAEVRPPVGSHVVVGRFELLREMRVLDLDRLSIAYANLSPFSPEYVTLVGRIRFFRRLVAEISAPVMPRDEHEKYLVTQVVAEFLATSISPKLDGILFNSAQTNGEGRNLMLFHHASAIEAYELPPGTKVRVNLGWSSGNDEDDTIGVWETAPLAPLSTVTPKPQSTAAVDDLQLDLEYSLPDPDHYEPLPLDPSIRLLVDEITVQRIKAVQYDQLERLVYRTRDEEGAHSDIIEEPPRFLYFAYGSNMCGDRLRYRVTGFRFRGVATLVGYQLRFHKRSRADGSAKCDAFATGNPSDIVIGVVYDVPRSQKPLLDKFEGLGSGYDDATINVIMANGAPVEAITYLASKTALDATLRPYTWYKDFVLEGAKERGLPSGYIASAIEGVVAVDDPDKTRDTKKRAERTKKSVLDF